MPDVDQEFLESMQGPPISIDESAPFESSKPGILVTKGKVNGLDGSFLFDTGYLPNVISYETCKHLIIDVKKRPEYISIKANKTPVEIIEATELVTIDLHY